MFALRRRRQRGRFPRVLALALMVGFGSGIGAFASVNAAAQTTPYADKIGVELDGIGDGARAKPFVDVAKTLRPWTTTDGNTPAPLDANGWPKSDAMTVLFDIRPVPAWNPPIDDPDAFQPDWSGTYKLRFTGQAVLAPGDAGQARIANQRYDAPSNTTTADVIVPKGAGLLVLSFTQTRRTANSPTDTGLTNLRMIRPGYPADTKQVFTNEFLASLQPFRILRFMDWTSTNHNPGFYGDAGHHALNWADRHLPTDATQQDYGTKYGAAWEYVIALANRAHKDIWINIPVAATDDYVQQLARLLKKTLAPDLKIYLEHSNEVWNFGFPQYTYNKLAAVEEVGKGRSSLNSDGTQDQEEWARRRHAKRLIEIATIFKGVFGAHAIPARIRPIYAAWVIQPEGYYANVLKWVATTYGPPKNYFYGIAGAAYFNAEKAAPNASPEEIVRVMRAASDNNRKWRTQIQAIAAAYGLKHCQYEVGPDNGGGSTVNVANRIRANRLPSMKELMLHDARDNWFARGGDLYMVFAHCSAYSRYGCWGLSEDIANRNTPKWQAIYELTGFKPAQRENANLRRLRPRR